MPARKRHNSGKQLFIENCLANNFWQTGALTKSDWFSTSPESSLQSNGQFNENKKRQPYDPVGTLSAVFKRAFVKFSLKNSNSNASNETTHFLNTLRDSILKIIRTATMKVPSEGSDWLRVSIRLSRSNDRVVQSSKRGLIEHRD